MDSPDPDPIKEYRMAKGYVWLAVGGVAFSLLLVAGGTLVACTDPDVKDPGWLLILTNMIGGGVLVLGLYLLAACFRGKLLLHSWGIRDKGVFRTRDISFSDIDKLIWEPATGTVALVSPALPKARIHFRNYAKTARPEIVAFLREKLPEGIQHDWTRFLQYNVPDSAVFKDHQEQLWKRKAWSAVFIGMIFFGFGTAFLVMEHSGKKWATGQKEAIVALNWGGAAILFLSAANHWRKNRRKE